MIASPSLLRRSGMRTTEQFVTETWLTSENRPRDWEAWLEAAGQPTLRASRTSRFVSPQDYGFRNLSECGVAWIEPYAWLKRTLEQLPSYSVNRVHELLPLAR